MSGQEIALLKYQGGGDWCANPTALPNLIKFCNQNINTAIKVKVETVTPESIAIFQYPFIHMTGHGNVFFSNEEAENLRTYLLGGGFLHIDDNYGMNDFIRTELKKVLEKHSRKTQFLLLKTFERKTIRRDPLKDRRIVFKKVFEEKYSKDKDFKLRNELRLLSRMIESFLIRKEMEMVAEENPGAADLYLLKSLSRRERFDLVSKLSSSKIKAAVAGYQFDLATEMEQIRFLDHSLRRSTKKGNLEKGVEALKNRKNLLDKHHFKEARIIRSQVAFSQLTVANRVQFIHEFPGSPLYDPEEL